MFRFVSVLRKSAIVWAQRMRHQAGLTFVVTLWSITVKADFVALQEGRAAVDVGQGSSSQRTHHALTKQLIVIRSKNVVLPDGIKPASVSILGGKFVDVSAYEHAVADGTELIDVGSLHVMAGTTASSATGSLCTLLGVVDSHVHVNDPGRTEWEGFETATKAAASGGTQNPASLSTEPPSRCYHDCGHAAEQLSCNDQRFCFGNEDEEHQGKDLGGRGAARRHRSIER